MGTEPMTVTRRAIDDALHEIEAERPLALEGGTVPGASVGCNAQLGVELRRDPCYTLRGCIVGNEGETRW
jgi:hypothetical protein